MKQIITELPIVYKFRIPKHLYSHNWQGPRCSIAFFLQAF